MKTSYRYSWTSYDDTGTLLLMGSLATFKTIEECREAAPKSGVVKFFRTPVLVEEVDSLTGEPI